MLTDHRCSKRWRAPTRFCRPTSANSAFAWWTSAPARLTSSCTSKGVVIYTGAVPIRRGPFHQRYRRRFPDPIPDAESIKKMFGCAIVTRIPEGNEIEVPSVGDRPSRLMQQRMLAKSRATARGN